MTPRLLQVCNVGQICGGTAACAWTVARALPGFEHVVAFLGPIADETRTAFQPHRLLQWSRVSRELVHSVRPDVVLLHNTSHTRVEGTWRTPTVLYLHSQISPARADVTVCCSKWLAARCGRSADDVLWQAVPRAPRRPRDVPDASLVIGRICTPQVRKWPPELAAFYHDLANRCPDAWWEFVGCPADVAEPLAAACRGRARFWTAGWERRSLLTTWDALLHHQPSLPESFGRTVAEAMRVGCVPVVDAQGGFVEQLDEGGGYLCRGVGDYANAIEELHRDDCRQQQVEQACLTAEKRWSLGRFARDLLRCFDQAAAR